MSDRPVANARLGIAALALAIAVPAYAASTIAAQWSMDDSSSTTMIDSSSNHNAGTLYSVVTAGAGYVFNGTSSKVVVPDSPSLNPGTRDFSFTVQVQTDRIPPSGTDYDLLRKGLSTTAGGDYKVEVINSNG